MRFWYDSKIWRNLLFFLTANRYRPAGREVNFYETCPSDQIGGAGLQCELELEPGDKILQINGQDIEDVSLIIVYIQNEEIDMVVQKRTAQEVEWEFDKDLRRPWHRV